jgi:hypothetical protein
MLMLSTDNARHDMLMAEDAVIETHNKKLQLMSDKVLQTQDRVAKAQQIPITISSHLANNQCRRADIEKAQNAEVKALTNFAKAGEASTSLLHSGSRKVAVLLPSSQGTSE